MSVFDPESSCNHFGVGYELTGNAGNPYDFGLLFSVDDTHMTLDQGGGRSTIQIEGISMNDMIRLHRTIGRVIKEARQAKKEQNDAC